MKKFLASLRKFVVSKYSIIVLGVAAAWYVYITSAFVWNLYAVCGLLGSLMLAGTVVFAHIRGRPLLSHGLLLFIIGVQTTTLQDFIRWDFVGVLGLIIGIVDLVILAYAFLAVWALCSGEKPVPAKIRIDKSLLSIVIFLAVVYLRTNLNTLILSSIPIIFILLMGDPLIALFYASAYLLPNLIVGSYVLFRYLDEFTNYINVALLVASLVFIVLDIVKNFTAAPKQAVAENKPEEVK